MDATTISLLACIFSFLAVLATVRLTRRKPRHDASDHFICGDHPAVPSDFKLRHDGRNSQ
jgi:hypothetical protein